MRMRSQINPRPLFIETSISKSIQHRNIRSGFTRKTYVFRLSYTPIKFKITNYDLKCDINKIKFRESNSNFQRFFIYMPLLVIIGTAKKHVYLNAMIAASIWIGALVSIVCALSISPRNQQPFPVGRTTSGSTSDESVSL